MGSRATSFPGSHPAFRRLQHSAFHTVSDEKLRLTLCMWVQGYHLAVEFVTYSSHCLMTYYVCLEFRLTWKSSVNITGGSYREQEQ